MLLTISAVEKEREAIELLFLFLGGGTAGERALLFIA